MKRISYLIGAALLAMLLFYSCDYDDDALWNKVNEHENRLKELEDQAEKLNADITSLRSIVNALNGNDWITGVEPLPDETGYVIHFSKQASITITHGAPGNDAIEVGVKEENGVHYWTLGDEWILRDPENGNDPENRLPVTGNDATAPLLMIDEDTFEWKMSIDGGATWTSMNVVAKGDSFFSGVRENDNSVTFILANGTELEVPLYNPPGLTFTGLDDESTFTFVADNTVHELGFTASEDIIRIGIASPNPAPNGWKLNVSDDKIQVSAQDVYIPLNVLVVATTAEGTSASYWITLTPLVTEDVNLQNLISELENAGGGTLHLSAGTFSEATSLTFSKAITIKGVSPDETILATTISSDAPVNLESMTIIGNSSSLINMSSGAPFNGTDVVLRHQATGGNNVSSGQPAILTDGDVELYNSEIVLESERALFGIKSTGKNVYLDNTSITTTSAETGKNATYSIGVYTGGTNSKVTFKNGEIKGTYYPFYLSYLANGLTLDVEDATIDGYCALYVWTSNATINVKNSTLIGRNLYNGNDSDFAVVVLDERDSDADNNIINITDSQLTSLMSGSSLEYLLSLQGENNTINLKGKTTLTDATGTTLDYMLNPDYKGINSIINCDPSVKLEGKEGVEIGL